MVAGMRVGVGCLCIVAVCLLRGRPSFATDDWQDGCPAFVPAESRPDYISNVPTNDGDASFGVLPELDSPLGTTRLAAEGWLNHTTQRISPDGSPEFAGAWQGMLQLNMTSGPMFALRVAGGEAFGGADGDHDYHGGDVQAFIGYRYTKYLYSPLARFGAVLRLGGGGAPFDGNAQSLIDQRERLAAISPFHTSLFGFDRPLILTFEGRIELIGCHAPFVDFRLDGVTWQTQLAGTSVRVYDLPIEIASGGYLLPWLAGYLAVGVELRSPESTLLFSYLVRTGAGLEAQVADHTVRMGLRTGVIAAGPNAAGFDVGLTFSWKLPWGAGTLE